MSLCLRPLDWTPEVATTNLPSRKSILLWRQRSTLIDTHLNCQLHSRRCRSRAGADAPLVVSPPPPFTDDAASAEGVRNVIAFLDPSSDFLPQLIWDERFSRRLVKQGRKLKL